MNDSAQWIEDQEDDFNLLGSILKFLRYWYWFLIVGFISIFLARLYLRRYTPIFRMSATVLIKEDRSLNNSNSIVDQLDLADSKNLDNEMEILKSRPLIEKVVDNLGLTATYWYEGTNRDNEIYDQSPIKIASTEILSGEPFFIQPLVGNKYALMDQEKKLLGRFSYSEKVKSKYGKFRVSNKNFVATSETPAVKVTLQNRENVVNELIGAIQISRQKPKSTLVSLSIENAVPQKGKDILQNLLDEYTFTTLADKNREATNTLRFIEERLKIVTSELGNVEQNVEQYRKSKGITDLSTEANLFLDKVQENDSKLNEVDINLRVLDGVESYVTSNEVGNIAPATLGVNDAVLTSYIEQLSQLEAERSKLAQTVQAGNPYLETLTTQMRNVKQAIQENLKNQRNNLMVAKNSLTALNNRLEGTISTIPRKEREFLDIKRQAGVKENLYLLLLQKREETALSYASTVTDSRVVEPPYTIPGPIKPNKRQTYTYAFLIGLLIPAAVIYVRSSMRNTVQSKKEIEKKTGLRVFGEISIAPKNQEGHFIDLNSRSFISEQVRMIRSNMQYLFTDEDKGLGRTLIVTSSTSGEGKSFVAINLAASLALLNKKVIILGLDLRKPKVNEYLEVSNKVGISNYLIGKASEDEIIQKTAFYQVSIASSGPIPPNPSELIANNRIEGLIMSLRSRFDYIVIDTPPLSLVTDTILLAPFADATFYIVRHEKTPKQNLNIIKELSSKKQFKSLSIIFNAVNYKNSSEYGYGYGYGYGKSSYYGNEEESGWLKRLFSRKKLSRDHTSFDTV